MVQWLRVGLVFSGSADRIPEGEVCFLIIKKKRYCLLVISKLPHGPRKDLNLRDYLLLVRLGKG